MTKTEVDKKKLLINYVSDNIKWFADIEDTYTSGVYMINDFYIGSTSNIKGRIAFHILDLQKATNINVRKNKLIKGILDSGSRLIVKMLSSDRADEERLIREYSMVQDLTNIEFNDNNNPNERYNLFIKGAEDTEVHKSINIMKDVLGYKSLKQLHEKLYLYPSHLFTQSKRYSVVITNQVNKKFIVYTSKNDGLLNNLKSGHSVTLDKMIKDVGIDSIIIRIVEDGDKEKLTKQMIKKKYTKQLNK